MKNILLALFCGFLAISAASQRLQKQVEETGFKWIDPEGLSIKPSDFDGEPSIPDGKQTIQAIGYTPCCNETPQDFIAHENSKGNILANLTQALSYLKTAEQIAGRRHPYTKLVCIGSFVSRDGVLYYPTINFPERTITFSSQAFGDEGTAYLAISEEENK